MPGYDPKAYWSARANPNRSTTAPSPMLAYLRRHLADHRRVFELGPGVGRTFEVYRPGTQVATVDITDRYADTLAGKAAALGLELEPHVAATAQAPLPFADRAFALGVCAQVLLHVPPSTIADTLRELARVCERCVVVTAATAPSTKTAAHCFAHDYLRLCGAVNAAMDDAYVDNDLLFFVLRRRS